MWKILREKDTDLNIEELERHFCKPKTKVAMAAKQKKNKDGGQEEQPRGAGDDNLKPVLLLEPKRQQNVGIALARYKLPPAAIKEVCQRHSNAHLNLCVVI